MRVGIVSDTHGRFDAALPLLFARCDLILHAGDIVGREILFQLQSLAPVMAVRGNNDTGGLGAGLDEEVVAQLEGVRALVIHALGKPERLLPAAHAAISRERPELVVYGHSHKPAVSTAEGVLYVNPGAAGPRRFSLPRSAGILTVRDRRVRVELFDLETRGLDLLEPPVEHEFAEHGRSAER